MAGLALCEAGRSEAARPLLEHLAPGSFAAFPSNFTLVFALTVTAEVCARLGDVARAGVLYDRLAPYEGLAGAAGATASSAVDHYLGLLAATMERFDDASRHFHAAAALEEYLAAPTWLARTRLEWARMLLTRSGGDADQARDLLAQALAAARELGLAAVERSAIALLG